MFREMTEGSEVSGPMAAFVDQSALPEEAPDVSLALLAARGDRDAFGQLVERHYEYIFRIACKWSGFRKRHGYSHVANSCFYNSVERNDTAIISKSLRHQAARNGPVLA
jgi:hypothetical protein